MLIQTFFLELVFCLGASFGAGTCSGAWSRSGIGILSFIGNILLLTFSLD